MVRRAYLRHPSRYRDNGEGPVVRLPADQRGLAWPAHGGYDSQCQRRAGAWLYVLGPSGRECGGAENLEVIENLELPARVKKTIGPYLQQRLHETFDNHPLVGEVRGLGLLAAIELVPNKPERSFFPDVGRVGTHCRNYCFNSGLISRAIRDTMVLAPPLVVSEAEIQEIVAKLREAVDRTARDFGKM